jgi:hypothetical protein
MLVDPRPTAQCAHALRRHWMLKNILSSFFYLLVLLETVLLGDN